MAAALSRTSPISREFALISELISRNTNDNGLRLPPDKASTLLKRLDEINHKIGLLERELGVYRVREQDKATAGILNDLCMEVLQDGVLDAASGAPVVYPDFRKGKQP